jgi:protein TonB
MARTLGIVCAVVLHAGFLLFGGLIFPKAKPDAGSDREVELISEAEAEEAKKEEPKQETPRQPPEELQDEQNDLPNPDEVARSLEPTPMNDAPALDAASLSAIEQALSGQGAVGGDFADVLSFASGGRIGGTGKGGALGDAESADAFDMNEIDQKPRATFQASPIYPSELHGKKLEGVVTLIFVVDESGRVTQPRVEKSTHPAFDKPALDALRQWRFEPAVRGGQRVPWKMRVGIRFQPS